MKIGLALAGGGIKGAAHIGILKAFEKNNIKIDMISGASSGSIVAALYAMGYRVDEIYFMFKEFAKNIRYADVYNVIKLIYGLITGKGVIIKGLTAGKNLEKYIIKKCEEKGIYKIKDVKFPLYISSVDLNTGATYIFTNSTCKVEKDLILLNDIELFTAIRASCSYPGIFEPVEWKKRSVLIDGGIRENIPWKVLKNAGADRVISVIFKNRCKKNCYKNMISVIDCSIGYLSSEVLNYELVGTKDIIEIQTEDVGLLEYAKIDYLYELGLEAGEKYISNS